MSQSTVLPHRVRPIRPSRPRALSPRQIVSLQAVLITQRAFRIEQLAQLQRPGDPGPLGDADAEVVRTLRDAARRALHEVSHALWRIEDGTFGACTSCRQPIAVERLTLVPQTALCMQCQRESDELHRATA